jgi:hypothetical protein
MYDTFQTFTYINDFTKIPLFSLQLGNINLFFLSYDIINYRGNYEKVTHFLQIYNKVQME